MAPSGSPSSPLTDDGDIGRIDVNGVITVHYTSKLPAVIVPGQEGALWFTNSGGIGRCSLTGVITQFSWSTAGTDDPQGAARGPDGAVWFTEYGSNKIGRIDVEGAVTTYTIPTAASPSDQTEHCGSPKRAPTSRRSDALPQATISAALLLVM